MTRNVRILRISTQVVAEILKIAAKNRLPDDSKLVGANYNHMSNSFDMFVESNEFEPVEEGSEAPLHPHIETSTTFLDMIMGRKK